MNHDPTSTTSRGHRWLMAFMCAPMLLIVALLIATGAVGAGALLPALLCVGGMALMMFVMGRTHRNGPASPPSRRAPDPTRINKEKPLA